MNLDKEFDKEFYTTKELVEHPNFPIRSTITVTKLIENGELEAFNVSTNKNFKRYRISRASVIGFLTSRMSTLNE